ncbi:hypothetical protein [Paeniglutamicibacter kerguelensis]|uniref:hypothetical protein n=1 Tax=Paeniglutamicibacter kerguelensis TaxID=254788 RepID=UPI00362100D2
MEGFPRQHRDALNDFSGIPRAYIEVGDLDIFRDESIAYARGLYDAAFHAT